MLSDSDLVRLRHMLDAARIAVQLSEGRRREDLDDDEDALVHALVRLVTVVGEAANEVSTAACAEIDEVPWPDVVGMRNRLVHAYFDIDLDILWATVRSSLPDLIRKLESALPPLENV